MKLKQRSRVGRDAFHPLFQCAFRCTRRALTNVALLSCITHLQATHTGSGVSVRFFLASRDCLFVSVEYFAAQIQPGAGK